MSGQLSIAVITTVSTPNVGQVDGGHVRFHAKRYVWYIYHTKSQMFFYRLGKFYNRKKLSYKYLDSFYLDTNAFMILLLF